MADRMPLFFSPGSGLSNYGVSRGRGRGKPRTQFRSNSSPANRRKPRSNSSPADPSAVGLIQKHEPRKQVRSRTVSNRPLISVPPVISTGAGHEHFELYILAAKEGLSSALQLLEQELSEIVCLWWNFGLKLGLSKEQLDAIEKDYQQRCGIERCRIEMLDTWLNGVCYPRWIDIIRALDKIGSRFMAAKIAEKYAVDITSPIFKDTISFQSDAQYEEVIAEFRKIDKKLGIVQERYNNISQRVGDLLERMKKLEEKADFISKRLDSLSTDLHFFKQGSVPLTDTNQQTLIEITNAETAKDRYESTSKKLQGLNKEQRTVENSIRDSRVEVEKLAREQESLEVEKHTIMKSWAQEATRVEKSIKKLVVMEQELDLDSSVNSIHGMSALVGMSSFH